MRRLALLASLAALVALAHCQYLLPVSYLSAYDPGWDKLILGANSTPIVLVNPNSGPGPSPNDGIVKAYIRIAERCKASGMKVFGYVDSNYAKIPLSKVFSEMDQYFEWFNGVDGYFIDQASSLCSNFTYYQSIFNKTKAYNNNASLILNHGMPPSECYVNATDIMVSAEYDWKYYGGNIDTPKWIYNYPPERFYHIVYGVKDYSLSNALSLARKRNAGYVYFTDLGLPNPYGKLPAYLSTQVRQLVPPPTKAVAQVDWATTS